MSTVEVEVVLALPERQSVQRVVLPEGSTAWDAVAASGLSEEFRRSGTRRLGIHGKIVPAETILRDGDRVEIYRPLQADPKESRRARAAKKRDKA